MTIHPMPLKTQLVKLLNGWKNVLVICLNGLKIKAKLEKCYLFASKKNDINGVKIESSFEQKIFWYYY